jgi:hypothetical protein
MSFYSVKVVYNKAETDYFLLEKEGFFLRDIHMSSFCKKFIYPGSLSRMSGCRQNQII